MLRAGLIQISDGKKMHWLDPSDIEMINAEGNYVSIHLDSDTQLIRSTLKHIEEILTDYGFIRINRSQLINCQMILSYDFSNNKKLLLRMKNAQLLNVSALESNKGAFS